MIYSLFNSLEVSVASKDSSTMTTMYDLGPIQTSRHSTPTQRKVKTLKERRVKEKSISLRVATTFACQPFCNLDQQVWVSYTFIGYHYLN